MVIIILVCLFFVYLSYSVFLKEKPYKVLTPDVYEEGTTVSLYKNVPPEFPKNVIAEEKVLNYSGTVSSPNGKKQITVSYVSDKTMSNLVTLYSEFLPKNNWELIARSVYEKVSIIQISKNERNIMLTIAPIKDGETMVTFQYEY